jgi:hypothetical protein
MRMGSYQIYGGCLESEIDLPELRSAATGSADWRLRVVDHCAPLAESVLIGEEQLLEHVTARLSRGADRFRLTFEDTGTFDVSLDGRDIAWCPTPGADRELARVDVLGRVMALAIHAGGDICLHASAVSVAGQAIAFLAPKGYGKSTLALSMLGAGAQLITDDTLRIRLGDSPIAVPGMYSIRLRGDSAERAKRSVTPEFDGKFLVDEWRDDELLPDEAPLAALYLLAPTKPSSDRPAVARHQLPTMHAMLGAAQQGKIAMLLGKTEGGIVARRMAALAARIPVYRLEVSRELDRVSEVADTVCSWHGAPRRADAMVVSS